MARPQAWTAFFKTEQIPSKLFPKGHTWFNTSINNPINPIERATMFLTLKIRHSSADVNQVYYLHDDAPTEPGGDGLISSDIYGGLAVEYSATGETPGYIKSFTSEAGIFTANQNFANHNAVWEITYLGKYAGDLAGRTPFLQVEFYKRDEANNDTLLFTVFKLPLGLFYSETTRTFPLTGSVAITDRLRIRFYGYSEIPA